MVRPSCRNCHISNSLPFDTESAFIRVAGGAASDLCGYQMPHALQVQRQFWLSSKPQQLESYWRGVGQTAPADHLHACSGADVSTLDPQFTSAIMN